MFPLEGPLGASREEDLPGYTQPRRRTSSSVTRLLAIFLLALLLTPAEGCLPSWFREQRSSQPAALEGSGAVLPEESPGAALRPQRVMQAGTPHRPSEVDEDDDEGGEYDEEEEEKEESHLGRYGTAAPVAEDRQLEEARKAFAEIECTGYCFAGGTCHIEVEPLTYRYIGKRCTCPPNYTGTRCDAHYMKGLYAPVKGQGFHVERSAVPALAFFLIMVVVTVGLAIYSYRKITKRNEHSWHTSPSLDLSQQCHLRRNRGIYGGGGRSPFSPRLEPRYTPKMGPLLLQGGELALPFTNVSPPLPALSRVEADRRDNSAQMGESYHSQRMHDSRDSSLVADSVRLPSPHLHPSPHRDPPA